MTLLPYILSALLALPISKHDLKVDPTVKRAQIETIANAIDVASRHPKWPGTRLELAAMLIIVARFESALALRIHAGKCEPHECDKGRARGLWQQQASSTSSREAWQRLGGLDEQSTTFAAREAARALVRARWMCRSLEQGGGDWIGMTFTAYAGRGCNGWFSGRNVRVSAFRRLLAL